MIMKTLIILLFNLILLCKFNSKPSSSLYQESDINISEVEVNSAMPRLRELINLHHNYYLKLNNKKDICQFLLQYWSNEYVIQSKYQQGFAIPDNPPKKFIKWDILDSPVIIKHTDYSFINKDFVVLKVGRYYTELNNQLKSQYVGFVFEKENGTFKIINFFYSDLSTYSDDLLESITENYYIRFKPTILPVILEKDKNIAIQKAIKDYGYNYYTSSIESFKQLKDDILIYKVNFKREDGKYPNFSVFYALRSEDWNKEKKWRLIMYLDGKDFLTYDPSDTGILIDENKVISEFKNYIIERKRWPFIQPEEYKFYDEGKPFREEYYRN